MSLTNWIRSKSSIKSLTNVLLSNLRGSNVMYVIIYFADSAVWVLIGEYHGSKGGFGVQGNSEGGREILPKIGRFVH